MSVLSSALLTIALLMVLMQASIEVGTLISNGMKEWYLAQRIVDVHERYEFEASPILRNDTALLLEIRITERGLPCELLPLFDFLLRYRDTSGDTRLVFLRFGREWIPVNVSFGGKSELINPSDLSSLSGVIDPGESLLVAIHLPSDVASGSELYVTVTSPGGYRRWVTS